MTLRAEVFISAVSCELRSARQLVANTLSYLGYEPLWQDIFGTESGDLRSVLRGKIDNCKGVIQLIGQCYGAEPPQSDAQFGRVSYTQFEALYARQRGKKVWYLFIDDNFPTDPHEPEPAELRELQTAYRRRVQSDAHLFHALNSREALEANVLKLRDDLVRLRRGVKQWSIGVAAVLLLLVALVLWLVRGQTQMTAEVSKLRQGIVDYPQIEARLRQAEQEKTPDKKDIKITPDEVYAELGKQLGVDPAALREKLPKLAQELKRAPDTSNFVRAGAAYVAQDYSEAETLAARAVDDARKSATAQPKATVEALKLAALVAQKHDRLGAALIHYREAQKLIDRKKDSQAWEQIENAIASVQHDLQSKEVRKLDYKDSVSDLKP